MRFEEEFFDGASKDTQKPFPTKVASVPELLRSAAKIYEERNKIYGDNYKRFGAVMHLLFPEGLHLKSNEDHNRMGIFVQIVAKITRYAENFERGGHKDSLDDTAVYSMMLAELDAEIASRNVSQERGK